MGGKSSSSKDAFSQLLGEFNEKYVKPTKDQHFLAAERWRWWACLVEYSSTVLALGGAAISAGVYARSKHVPGSQSPSLFSMSVGVFVFSAPIAFSPASFHYHPRSLYD